MHGASVPAIERYWKIGDFYAVKYAGVCRLMRVKEGPACLCVLIPEEDGGGRYQDSRNIYEDNPSSTCREMEEDRNWLMINCQREKERT